MSFIIDERINATCITLGQWPLSQVLLKDNADYPWLILVPRITNIQDVDQLSQQARHQLSDEIAALSELMKHYFKPDKVNVATLGNIVSQLHIHVVGRFATDKLWPHGIWQAEQATVTYDKTSLQLLQTELSAQITDLFILR